MKRDKYFIGLNLGFKVELRLPSSLVRFGRSDIEASILNCLSSIKRNIIKVKVGY